MRALKAFCQLNYHTPAPWADFLSVQSTSVGRSAFIESTFYPSSHSGRKPDGDLPLLPWCPLSPGKSPSEQPQPENLPLPLHPDFSCLGTFRLLQHCAPTPTSQLSIRAFSISVTFFATIALIVPPKCLEAFNGSSERRKTECQSWC